MREFRRRSIISGWSMMISSQLSTLRSIRPKQSTIRYSNRKHVGWDRTQPTNSFDRGRPGPRLFKALPVQDVDHLVSVLRYVERNALRAELLSQAEDWKWSRLPGWGRGDPFLWNGDEPVRDEKWLERVNEPLSTGDLQRLRHSVSRGRPYGHDAWTRETANRLGLESRLRSPGRPLRRTCKRAMSPVSRLAAQKEREGETLSPNPRHMSDLLCSSRQFLRNYFFGANSRILTSIRSSWSIPLGGLSPFMSMPTQLVKPSGIFTAGFSFLISLNFCLFASITLQ